MHLPVLPDADTRVRGAEVDADGKFGLGPQPGRLRVLERCVMPTRACIYCAFSSPHRTPRVKKERTRLRFLRPSKVTKDQDQGEQ
jgi:hypothetical protein